MHSVATPFSRLIASAFCVAALSGCSGSDTRTDSAGPDPAGLSSGAGTSELATSRSLRELLRPLSVAPDRRIVDDRGREVLLRGTNVTSLGEYWQGDPDEPPTLPTTEADWEEMAAHGFSVVRLVVHWSRLEPRRGEFDGAYVDEIDRYVSAAADRGIYTVIDMHQDAYSANTATPDGTKCPEGTQPAKSWDGAPAWATLTDGGDTCQTRERNDPPAVVNAWNNFYADTDGIRGRFVATWGKLAAHFAGRPEVAGYDILNEPEVSRPAAQLAPLYNTLVRDTITAIREAEAGTGFPHLLFVEPAIPAGNASFGIVVPDVEGFDTTGVVAAPHNYAGSIQRDVPFAQMGDLFESTAASLGLPVWIGEYGWWSTDADSLARATDAAAYMDAHALGGAWWQWRQPCGDPHSLSWGGYREGAEPSRVVHLHSLECPGDIDLGPTEPLLRIVGRAYPRSTPGRITRLESDPESGILAFSAAGARPGSELVVWTPTSADTHEVATTGLGPVEEEVVGEGRLLTATVQEASYALSVKPLKPSGDPPRSASEATTRTTG